MRIQALIFSVDIRATAVAFLGIILLEQLVIDGES